MSFEERVRRAPKTTSSADGAAMESLAELALDMRSSWDHSADQIWRPCGFAPADDLWKQA